jgi:hypothetical protein
MKHKYNLEYKTNDNNLNVVIDEAIRGERGNSSGSPGNQESSASPGSQNSPESPGSENAWSPIVFLFVLVVVGGLGKGERGSNCPIYICPPPPLSPLLGKINLRSMAWD